MTVIVSLLDAALRYAAAGLRVFPVFEPRGGRCSCPNWGCRNPGKHPRTAHGLLDATTDETAIRARWTQWPQASVAIAAGAASDVFVIDIDDEDEWQGLLDRLGQSEPATLQARTGKGGRHLFFSHPGAGTKVKTSVGELTKRGDATGKVDVRGDGGYVVAAPSMHVSGRRYEWLDLDEGGDIRGAITPAPAWLLELVTNDRPATSPAPRGAPEPGWRELPEHEVARIESALAAISADCSRDVWLRVGMALRSTGAGEQAFAIWNTWSHTAPHRYNARDQRRQWDSLTETKPGAREVTIAALFGMALEAGWVEASATRKDVAITAPGVNGAAPAARSLEAGELEPTDRVRPWPAPLGQAAMHGLAGDLVRTVEPFTEADPVAVLVHFLAMYGIALSKGPHFRIGATKHCGNLFFGIVGATGSGRKGTASDVVEEAFKRADPIAKPDPTDLPTGPPREAGFMARVMGGLATGEGLIHHVRDERWQKLPVRQGGKPTGAYEDTRVDEGVSDKRLLLIEPELARVFGVMRREGATLSPILRHSWDGKTLKSMAKTSGETATEPHVGLVGHITRHELLSVFEDVEAANGFGNRFAWICCRRSKELPDAPSVPHEVLAEFGDRIRRSLERARQLGEMTLTQAAQARWRLEYGRLTSERPGLLGSMLARGAPIVRRLAMIYACTDGVREIGLAHLEAALEVWRYSEESAAWIFGDRLGDDVADRIHDALRGRPDGMTKTDVNNLFGRNVQGPRLRRAIELLLQAGVAEEVQTPLTGARGRPATVLRIRAPR